MAAKNLSKENLKNELIAHNVPLPPSGSKKEKYVELYEKHISTQNSFRTEFSSDEEEAGRSPKMRVKRSIFTSLSPNDSMEKSDISVEISELSDDDLRHKLMTFNETVGPIVATTRSLYEKRLAKLLSGAIEGEIGAITPKEDEYSDSEDETESHHSANLSTAYYSNRKPDLRHRGKSLEDSIIDNQKKLDNESAFTHFSFTRDSPTPRRSLRPNISYTPTDRKLVNSVTRERFNNSRKVELGNIASTVVEQIQEPVQPKRNFYFLVLKVVAVIAAVLIIFLVYQNMEANGGENVEKLPGDSSPLVNDA